MYDMSVTVVIGRVGAEPQLRKAPSGTSVLNFSVAKNRRRKNGTAWVNDDPMWFRVAVWGEQAERAATWLHRGARVCVVGDLDYGEAYAAAGGGKRRDLVLRNVRSIVPFEKVETSQLSQPEPGFEMAFDEPPLDQSF